MVAWAHAQHRSFPEMAEVIRKVLANEPYPNCFAAWSVRALH